MLPNDQLLAAIRERKSKNAEFNSGIILADRYVKTLQECVGSDLCYRYAAKGNISFQDVIKAASNTLTYNNPDMVVEDLYTKSHQILDHNGEALELPKKTLMVFRHTLTTPRKDRDGDIMRTQGAKPDPKMLLLWQHVHTLPIGKFLLVHEHNSKRLSVYSCIVDMNELCHDSAVMIESKMGRFSHGFKALEFSKIKEHREEEGGFDVKSFEIMEESLVSVPSNTDAETDEVILSLAEGGKFKSAMMLEAGKTIRAKKPLVIVVEKDVKKLGNLEVEEEHEDGTKSGKEGCTCGGASKETDDEKSEEEKGTDDKEMMMCPKCGEPMKGGTCKCGYTAKAKVEDDEDTEEEEKPETTEEETDEDEEEEEVAKKGGPGSGPRPGGGGSGGSNTYSHTNNPVSGSGVRPASARNPKSGDPPKAGHGATGSGGKRGTISKVSDGKVHITWNDGSTTVHDTNKLRLAEDPRGSTHEYVWHWDGKSYLDEKVGRTVSLKNMTNLQHAKKCVEEVHLKEVMLSMGGKALCKEAAKAIGDVLDTVPKENLGGETSVETIDATKAMAIFLADSTVEQRQKMKKLIDRLDAVDKQAKLTDEYLELKGGPGSGPRPGGGSGSSPAVDSAKKPASQPPLET